MATFAGSRDSVPTAAHLLIVHSQDDAMAAPLQTLLETHHYALDTSTPGDVVAHLKGQTPDLVLLTHHADRTGAAAFLAAKTTAEAIVGLPAAPSPGPSQPGPTALTGPDVEFNTELNTENSPKPRNEPPAFELCRHLKALPLLRHTPLILMGTAQTAHGEEPALAFAAGANEYIHWPCHPQEVLARVQNQLTLSRRRQQIRQQNALLLEEVRERKQIERTLRETEARYRDIFENANEGIFQISAAGRYLQVNPALAHIYGYESPATLVASVTDIGRQLYAQPKRLDELVVYLQTFGQITGAESEMVRQDGTHIWVSETIRTVTDTEGKFLHYEGIVHDITERRQLDMELRKQRQQADRLLGNILPYQIAQRLKSGPRTIAESFSDVSVLFADLVDFTAASGQMQPKELVNLLNRVFSDFDRLAAKYQLEKIKTIGDAYMAAGGLPVVTPDHALSIARMALDMQGVMTQFTRPDGSPFRLRIGINVGPVIAGVIGMRKFAYDLWGDTVNLASRMETTGEAGRVQVTQAVYERLQNHCTFEPRGTIFVKGGGLVETYWLIDCRASQQG
jgi:PAS domain S-box-containing protein